MGLKHQERLTGRESALSGALKYIELDVMESIPDRDYSLGLGWEVEEFGKHI